ncbi:MAG: ABC transporter permease [Candidatus Eisenbacteria bacterium]|uniref:ABC transporter permease n=1 Tax=Eiseniibacteriota bacterium TaxID=2212470 RepID=A0A937X9F1_UNCEI|nr:ABC transporter permease [Candidatus Eisenbacteria bacterium]
MSGILSLLAQTLRISVPYGLAATGGVCSERGGVVNIALEGILLHGAFFAVVGTHYSGSPCVGILAAAAGGVATASVHAFVTVTCKADQIVSGLAINIAAFGLTRGGLRLLFASASNSPRIPSPDAGLAARLPGGESALGAVLYDPLFLLAVALVAAASWLLFRTGLGLALRAAGEHPEAAHSAGFSVARLRWLGVLASGLLGGLGGAWLAFEQHSFTDQMSGGRGYIALAAMIVGKWHPLGAAAACLLFGAAETVQMRLQGSGAPTQLMQMIPFLLTILVLVLWVGRAVAPAASGRPYDPEGES